MMYSLGSETVGIDSIFRFSQSQPSKLEKFCMCVCVCDTTENYVGGYRPFSFQFVRAHSLCHSFISVMKVFVLQNKWLENVFGGCNECCFNVAIKNVDLFIGGR